MGGIRKAPFGNNKKEAGGGAFKKEGNARPNDLRSQHEG